MPNFSGSLNFFGVNQQFRLFDSTKKKRGKKTDIILFLYSLKSSRDSFPNTDESGSGSGSESESDSEPVEAASFASSWLANLAIGDSTRSSPSYLLQHALVLAISAIIFILNL